MYVKYARGRVADVGSQWQIAIDNDTKVSDDCRRLSHKQLL